MNGEVEFACSGSLERLALEIGLGGLSVAGFLEVVSLVDG